MTGFKESNKMKASKSEQQVTEIVMSEDVQELVNMLSYMRPSKDYDNSKYYIEFIDKYIKPYFGEPDQNGNFVHIINDAQGDHPRIVYMAHHDTVHNHSGNQGDRIVYSYDPNLDLISLEINNPPCKEEEVTYTVKGKDGKTEKRKYKTKVASPDISSCLGADCTTGVWLIIEMIKANCPGVYVIHADEEIGCMGSSAIVKNYNLLDDEDKKEHWISKVDIAISFDRKEMESIITHQMGYRTASNEFANALSDILKKHFCDNDFLSLKPDSTGSYTDTNEYKDLISECTNLSVGYNRQHSEREYQEITYVLMLRDGLVKYAEDLNNPEKLPSSRDPDDFDYGGFGGWGNRGPVNYYDDYNDPFTYGYPETANFKNFNGNKDSYAMLRSEVDDVELSFSKHISKSMRDPESYYDYENCVVLDEVAALLYDYPYLVSQIMIDENIKPNTLMNMIKKQASKTKNKLRFEKLFEKDNSNDDPFDENGYHEPLQNEDD